MLLRAPMWSCADPGLRCALASAPWYRTAPAGALRSASPLAPPHSLLLSSPLLPLRRYRHAPPQAPLGAAYPHSACVPPAPYRVRACRAAEELFLHLGASIGYWRGDIKGLMDDIGGWDGACGRRQGGGTGPEGGGQQGAGGRGQGGGSSGKAAEQRCRGGRRHNPPRLPIDASPRACPPRPACRHAGALRPTMFCGVPRVFDRIYSGVMQKVWRCGVCVVCVCVCVCVCVWVGRLLGSASAPACWATATALCCLRLLAHRRSRPNSRSAQLAAPSPPTHTRRAAACRCLRAAS